MNSIGAKHSEEYSQEPQVIVEVPGVSVLFGEFTDHCKGFSVCAANDLRLNIALSRRDDTLVKMSNTFSGDHKRFSLSGIKFRKEDRWGNFVKGVVLKMINANLPLCGLSFTFSGSLLASDSETVSSAVGVGVALAINQLLGLNLENSQILRFVYQSNTSFCMESCKYMTLTTMLEAEEGSLLLFDNQQVTYRKLNLPNDWTDARFYVIDSRIPPLAMREELSIKVNAMKKAFEILRRNFPSGSIREVPDSELSERVIPIDEESRQICSYILEESRIASQAFKYFEVYDAVNIGKLMNRIQKGLRDKLDLTCPEVDWLVKRANEQTGCIGACMIPTGLSGSILLLMSNAAIEVFDEKLVDYEHIFGFSAKRKEFHCYGSARVSLP